MEEIGGGRPNKKKKLAGVHGSSEDGKKRRFFFFWVCLDWKKRIVRDRNKKKPETKTRFGGEPRTNRFTEKGGGKRQKKNRGN